MIVRVAVSESPRPTIDRPHIRVRFHPTFGAAHSIVMREMEDFLEMVVVLLQLNFALRIEFRPPARSRSAPGFVRNAILPSRIEGWRRRPKKSTSRHSFLRELPRPLSAA